MLMIDLGHEKKSSGVISVTCVTGPSLTQPGTGSRMAA